MIVNKTTRAWLTAVIRHALSPYGDEAHARAVLADHLATVKENHAKAVEWRKRVAELRMGRGSLQSASYAVSRNAQLIRWAEDKLAYLDRFGFEQFKTAHRGW